MQKFSFLFTFSLLSYFPPFFFFPFSSPPVPPFSWNSEIFELGWARINGSRRISTRENRVVRVSREFTWKIGRPTYFERCISLWVPVIFKVHAENLSAGKGKRRRGGSWESRGEGGDARKSYRVIENAQLSERTPRFV